MKKLTSYLTILLVAGALITGCKKDDDDSSVAPKGGLTAKIDGNNWKVDKTAQIIADNTGGDVDITAFDTDLRTVSFDTDGDSVGTYNITDSTFNGAGYSTASANYIATSGSIKITEKTATTVSGTFSFVAKNVAGADSVTVTEGSFNQVAF